MATNNNDDDEFGDDGIDWSSIPLDSILASVNNNLPTTTSTSATAAATVSTNDSDRRRGQPTSTTEEGTERHFHSSSLLGGSGSNNDGASSSSTLQRQHNYGLTSCNLYQNQLGMGAALDLGPPSNFPSADYNDTEALRRQVSDSMVLLVLPRFFFPSNSSSFSSINFQLYLLTYSFPLLPTMIILQRYKNYKVNSKLRMIKYLNSKPHRPHIMPNQFTGRSRRKVWHKSVYISWRRNCVGLGWRLRSTRAVGYDRRNVWRSWNVVIVVVVVNN